MTDLASYRIYYGTLSTPCPGPSFSTKASSTSSPSGQTETLRLTGLSVGTLYFASITAVDSGGNESACSTPVASAVARLTSSVTPTATTNFGSVAVGSFVDRTFTVQNTSGETVAGTVVTQAPFSVVSGSPFSLVGVNATQTVTVRFRPTIAATATANVNFAADGDTITRVVTGSVTGTDTTPPTVSITAPSAAATYTTNSSPLTLEGTAADDVGVTQVSWSSNRGGNGTASGTSTWSATGIVLQPGTNVLTVTARDAAANTGTATLTVTYTAPDTTAPTVSIITPSAAATYSTNTSPLTLGGTAADDVGVTQVTWTNGAGGSGTAIGTTAWSATGITLGPGTNVLTVTARDAAGNTGTATTTVTYDPTAPTVSITAPAAGAAVSGTTTIAANASDDIGVVGVQFLLDGAPLGTENTTTPYSVSWDSAGVANGSHTLAAQARDAAGNTTTSAGVAVTVSNTAASIEFMQGNYAVPQSPQSTVTVAFPGTQAAGNLNVIAVGWNDTTATVTSVADSAGNPYALAVGPTVRSGQASHAIYFATNIRASAANTVTVRFSTAAIYPDIRILEYSGLDRVNPLHATAVATGSSDVSTTSALTTSAPKVLLVAANVVATLTTDPGTEFTTRMITTPNGDIVADRVITAAGSYSATASLSGSGYWVMQLVAFQAAATAPPPDETLPPDETSPPDTTSPTIAITTPSAGATYTTNTSPLTLDGTATDDVGVTQVSWANSAGGSGTATGTTSWTASGIPLQVGSNVLTVTARDAAGNTATQTLTITYSPTVPTVALTVTPAGTGAGTVTSSPAGITCGATCSASYASGTAITLTATPTAGSTFSGWGGGGCSGTGSCSVTLDAATTVTATFDLQTPPVAIRFVQGNYAVPQTPQATVGVAFGAAQTAGNLNAIVVGWNDSTATVSSVTDSAGNVYNLAAGPTVRADEVSQAVYFAKDIRGSASNTVTVRFSIAAVFPDIRILEYAGLDRVNPLHAVATDSGAGVTASTGPVITTVPNVLLLAANTVGGQTLGAGPDFTTRMLTNPDSDIAQDRIVATVGSYTATAPLSGSYWVMQLVAFQAAGQ